MKHAGLVIAGSLLLTGCLSVDVEPARLSVGAPICGPGLEAHRTAQLYFGRNIGGTLGVSEADRAAFLDQEITPRFPDGLSVADVAGQWRGPSGEIVREPSKMVMILLTGAPGERAQLDAIRFAYVTRFNQDAVMLVEQAACVGF